jgi:hypothetical protein
MDQHYRKHISLFSANKQLLLDTLAILLLAKALQGSTTSRGLNRA